MTVKELKKLLEGCSDNAIVVLSEDGEGNGFSPLRSVKSQNTYCEGEIYLDELTDGLEQQGFTEENVRPPDEQYKSAVVLWP